MKYFTALLLSSALLIACSGKGADVTNDLELGEVSEMVDYVVSAYDELPTCNAKREGASAFVYDAEMAYICEDYEWVDCDSLKNLIYGTSLTDPEKTEVKSSSSQNEAEPDDVGEGVTESSSSSQIIHVRSLIWETPKESFFNPNIEYGSMTDERDGKVYKTVKIGDQVWMAENLNYDDSVAMSGLKGKMLDCGEKVGNCAVAGRMYAWTAAIDSLGLAHNKDNPQYCGVCSLPPRVQGVCPNGWHLPDFIEWNTLETTVRNSGNLKSNSGWVNDDYCILDSCISTDAYGFSAVAFGSKEDSSFAGNEDRYVLNGFGERAVFQVAYVSGYGSGYLEIYDHWDDPMHQTYRRWGGEIYASVRCLKDDGPAPKTEETRFNPDVAYDSLIDERDGQVYKTVKIGAQVWMAENLNYDDGKSKCVNDDAENCKILGRWYDWNAADSGCPSGWHLPDTTEWNDLFMDVSGFTGYGSRGGLKSQSGWSADGKGSNIAGFSAMNEVFWSASGDSWGKVYYVDIDRGVSTVHQDRDEEFQVRCVKDSALADAKASLISLEVVYDSITDERDGKVYKTVKIGEQTWMAENLNYDDSVATPSLNGRSWCYDNESENCDVRGRLYTWPAAIDSVTLANDADNPRICGTTKKECYLYGTVRGICPSGWHLPNRKEWKTLYTFAGGYTAAGWFLKSSTGWGDKGNGSDAYGFSAFPVGRFASKVDSFNSEENLVYFWTPDEESSGVGDNTGNVYCMMFGVGNKALLRPCYLLDAYSVRCLKDSPTE